MISEASFVDLALRNWEAYATPQTQFRDYDIYVVRERKNVKGRLLGLVVGTIGRRVLEKAFENSVKAIEARNSRARAT